MRARFHSSKVVSPSVCSFGHGQCRPGCCVQPNLHVGGGLLGGLLWHRAALRTVMIAHRPLLIAVGSLHIALWPSPEAGAQQPVTESELVGVLSWRFIGTHIIFSTTTLVAPRSSRLPSFGDGRLSFRQQGRVKAGR